MSLDHIALPESTLLRFGVSGSISFLDLKTNKFGRNYATRYNAQENYYPVETERYLSEKAEKHMGKVNEALERLAGRKKVALPYTPTELKELIFQFFAIQWLRTDDAKDLLRQKSVLAQALGLDESYFDIFRRGHDPSESKSPLQQALEENVANDLDAKVEEMKKNLLRVSDDRVCIPAIIDQAKCSSTFLLPTTHFMGMKERTYFILAPSLALVLLPKSEQTSDLLLFESDEEIDQLIPYAIATELKFGNGHIIGKKDQLLKAQQNIEEMRDKRPLLVIEAPETGIKYEVTGNGHTEVYDTQDGYSVTISNLEPGTYSIQAIGFNQCFTVELSECRTTTLRIEEIG